MSEHPDAYKHLANNPSYVEQIQQIEQELSNKSYSYIPKEEYAAMEAQLEEGDIVGFTTDISGLDVSHVGVIVRFRENFISCMPLNPIKKLRFQRTFVLFLRPIYIPA